MRELWTVFVSLLFLTGCGDGSYPVLELEPGKAKSGKSPVGGPCKTARDCAQFGGMNAICKKVSPLSEPVNWPGGYCTFGCQLRDSDCPAGTKCHQRNVFGVSFDAPYCLVICGQDDECAGFNPSDMTKGYVCSDENVCVPYDL